MNKHTEPTFRDPHDAFNEAIESGRLSASPGCNYAGDFMYMGTYSEGDAFKHKDTRRYLSHATKEGNSS